MPDHESLLFRDFSGIGNYKIEEILRWEQGFWSFCPNFVYKVVWVSVTDNKTESDKSSKTLFLETEDLYFWFLEFINFLSLQHVVILGDPGAVSRAGIKVATKVFKHGWKSPWVPTLTGPFPKGQANAGSWLGTKNALYYCAQSANSFSWVFFVNSYTTAIYSVTACLAHASKEMHAVRKLSVWYKLSSWKYCLPEN